MPHGEIIHDRSNLFFETGMTTRRCFREGPAYHWEKEEKGEEED